MAKNGLQSSIGRAVALQPSPSHLQPYQTEAVWAAKSELQPLPSRRQAQSRAPPMRSRVLLAIHQATKSGLQFSKSQAAALQPSTSRLKPYKTEALRSAKSKLQPSPSHRQAPSRALPMRSQV